MDIKKLRKIVSEIPKFPGTQSIKPASVCNKGFPGTFNLSYSEAEVTELFGQYLDYDREYIYSKIQPVIRYEDWENILNGKDSYRYLGLFDLADVGGAIILKDNARLNQAVEFSIKSLFRLLIEELKLDKSNLRISYFGGGSVRATTAGKYDFDFEFPSDDSIRYWKELGLSDDQFIADHTRDTLLALNVFGLPTPWGFRHEVYYMHQGKELDIATFECLIYRPIFDKNEKVVDLEPWNHAFVISAVGLERLLMVVNYLSDIVECAHIQPLVQKILSQAKRPDNKSAVVLCNAVRTIHRIISDCGGYDELSKKRKEKVRSYYKGVVSSCERLGIDLTESNLKEWFRLNADLQEYYPELKGSVTVATEEVIQGCARIKADKSKKGV